MDPAAVDPRHSHRAQGSRVVLAMLVLALLTVLTGCGGGSHRRSGGMTGADGSGMMGPGGMMSGRPGSTRGGTPTAPPAATTATGKSVAAGRKLFLASGCGGCHTLRAAGTTGTAGPNLDRARPSYGLVVRRVSDGAGGMPSFAGSLSGSQIDAIARFVASSRR